MPYIYTLLITARKQSLAQGNAFTPVCQSFCSQWLPKRAVHILLECILVRIRKLSCGKVMFSQACIKNSVHLRQGVYRSMHWGRHPPGPVHAGIHPPPPTATAADGLHPIGMHSCYILNSPSKQLTLLY